MTRQHHNETNTFEPPAPREGSLENNSTTENHAIDEASTPRWDGEFLKRSFDLASDQAWTLGYTSLETDELSTSQLKISGQLPATLRGTFYRNGPARHERGGQRYGHRWDGDGMVQAFRFDGQGVSHHGRYVSTEKYRAESMAGRFLVSTFGTCIPGIAGAPKNMDSANSANINVIPFGGELLALWEPGSAYRLDADSLETLGVKTWHRNLVGQPFSAHPKMQPDGTLWNFGVDPRSQVLTLYQINKFGILERSRKITVKSIPTIHDFGVTARHLVFLLPPLILSEDRLNSGMSFAESCQWLPELGMRVLVLDKSDWSQQWYSLPAGCLFHIANAWEDKDGVIRLSFMGSETPIPMMDGWVVMQGKFHYRGGAKLTLLEIAPKTGPVQTVVSEVEGEFPSIDPRVVGQRYKHLVCLGRSGTRSPGMVGYDELVRFDVETGACSRYAYGQDWLVEEHVLVADHSNPQGEARWVVGTALDLKERQSVVSVFRASAIAEGPVAQARLPYALPLGLHGSFRQHG